MAMKNYNNILPDLTNTLFKTVALYPVEFVKVLMMIGYKPTLSTEEREYFENLPAFVTYGYYIYKVEGIMGFAPGLQESLIVVILQYATVKTIKHFFAHRNLNISTEEVSQDEQQMFKIEFVSYLTKTAESVLCEVCKILVASPFQILAFRKIVQFVGKETKYVGLQNAMCLIYKEEGISSFYSGVVPRILREVFHIVLGTTVYFLLKTGFKLNDKIALRKITSCFSVFARHYTYPLYVVSACMAIHNSGLKADQPPYMPVFDGSWVNCYKILLERNVHCRGRYSFLTKICYPAIVPKSDVSDTSFQITDTYHISNDSSMINTNEEPDVYLNNNEDQSEQATEVETVQVSETNTLEEINEINTENTENVE